VTATLLHKAWPLYLFGQALLAFIFICLYLLAPEFDNMRPWVDRPLLEYVGLMMLAGITYCGLILLIPKLAGAKHAVWLLLIPGIILRLIIFPADPIQEDDYYRYLWDGAVTAEGYNPYASAPAEVLPSGLPVILPSPLPLDPPPTLPNTSNKSQC
jgi:alpha-1,6-mannosyltransferase